MRKDLDRLMQERGLAGLVIFANDCHCPPLYYATGQRMHKAIYFRGADGRAYLIHDHMERDQAAKVGCDHASFAQHGMNRLVDEEVEPAKIHGRLIGETLVTMGMKGRVAFFGDMDAGYAYQMLDRVRRVDPAIEVDVSYPDVLTLARETKGEDEIAAIRRVSRGNAATMEKVAAFLRGLRRDGDHFRANGASPATLGDVRRLIHREFIAHGIVEDGETIVSQGRDAGVPHNRGNDAEPIRASAPIIVDIFPGEAGGGYHSDLTRTFCVGPAPDALKRIYDQTRAAHADAMARLKRGEPCRSYQERVCDLFEKDGHPTPRSNPGTEEGYVHGLGHGVGLQVHEAPRLGGPAANTATLEPGMVFSVEPGLYYPSRGLGVRVEDLVVMRADGTIENLTPVSYDLEITPA